MGRRVLSIVFPIAAVACGAGAAALREIARTEPDQVTEIAPGVYFRQGDLLGKGHCNNGFVVFRDFVLVIDANFPSGAEACMADVRKVTEKPVRFVFDTHHHGDHVYGNPLWLKAGALPVSYEGVAREMARFEPERWRSTKRPDMTALGLYSPLAPIVTYPDRLLIDDGTQRVELLHFGTAHTRGDGFAYLPKHQILFTGDAVIGGPYNYMGDGDTSSWIQVIDALKRLDVDVVAGGHGPLAGREILDLQRLFIVELRAQVAAGIAAGKSQKEIAGSIRLPDGVKGYVGDQLPDQVGKIFREMAGLEMPLELVRSGIEEGPSPSNGDPGWTAPAKVVLTARREWLGGLERAAQGVRIVAPAGREAILREMADADGLIGALDAELLSAAKRLRWFQAISPDVDPYIGAGERRPGIPGLAESPAVITSTLGCTAEGIADQAFSYLLAFSRKTHRSIAGKGAASAEGKADRWKAIGRGDERALELRGMTMLILGARGNISEIARRAEGFGMTVLAIDPKSSPAVGPPEGVDELHRPADLMGLLPRTDVLVVACPLTGATDRWIGKPQIDALKAGSFLINVARGPIVDREAVAGALKSGKLAGAGLDAIDPMPLPDDDPLWNIPNAIITPGEAGDSAGSLRKAFLIVRENLRRFVAGERLLNVVDRQAGYRFPD